MGYPSGEGLQVIVGDLIAFEELVKGDGIFDRCCPHLCKNAVDLRNRVYL